MLYTSIQLAKKYSFLEEKFQMAFEFLENLPTELAERTEIAPGVVALFQQYETVAVEQARFESHERHFDIQYMVEGEEFFGVANREDLVVTDAYDADKDIAFYETPEYFGQLLLKQGEFALVAPEDAHKPQICVGTPKPVKKIVIKIAV